MDPVPARHSSERLKTTTSQAPALRASFGVHPVSAEGNVPRSRQVSDRNPERPAREGLAPSGAIWNRVREPIPMAISGSAPSPTPDSHEGRADAGEFLLVGTAPGIEPIEKGMEPPGMIEVGKVGEFVEHDVVLHPGRTQE